MGHPWPQAETLLGTVLECHIYLVSILFYPCFELLKRKPVLQCYVGVLDRFWQCSVSGGMQACFLMLSPAVMSVTPKVLLHPNISGAAVSTGRLNDLNSEKNTAAV